MICVAPQNLHPSKDRITINQILRCGSENQSHVSLHGPGARVITLEGAIVSSKSLHVTSRSVIAGDIRTAATYANASGSSARLAKLSGRALAGTSFNISQNTMNDGAV